MVVKDCPEFFYLFWGAIKAGLVPVPVNTLLRADDYRHIIEDSECAGLVYSPEYREEVTPALARSGHQPNFILCTEGPSSVSDMLEEASPVLEPAETSGGLRVLLAVLLGLYGPPQGSGASPPGT